jgi:2-oxoglutarate dehydrogenase E1 component
MRATPNAPLPDSASLPAVEELYAQFQADAASVGPEWRAYFTGWESGASQAGTGTAGDPAAALAEAWRTRGHLFARTNPLAATAPNWPAELQPATYGLTTAEPWAQIYGGSVGLEMAAIREPAEREWAQNWWEGTPAKPNAAQQERLYQGLVQANSLEQFLHKKFVGVKRFSIEGSDGLIPLLHALSEHHAAQHAGLQPHIIMGMAHRGRLNVLCNVLHKPLVEMLAAFAETLTTTGGPISGDVKYHLGKTYTHKAENGTTVTLDLLYNPSHLEAVNPMVLGKSRARAEELGSTAAVLPILVHGDSAVAGQGVVAECNNLMSLPAYRVGGTLHIVLNNQVGFTADPADAVGGTYSTDIFRSLGTPIVHVNADDIEACWQAVMFAYAYRQKWGKDVVLDLLGYRRWGHNEGDDPTFTQPLLYEKIRAHPTPAELYKTQLLAAGIPAATLAKIEDAYLAELTDAFTKAQAGYSTTAKATAFAPAAVTTEAEAGQLKKLADIWGTPPSGFVMNEKVRKVIDERVAMLRGEKPLNWGAAEAAAYGTLLQDGQSVRMTGQDVQRGTFSHRQCVLVGGADGRKWNVLQGLATQGATFTLLNSALSENAVMGFEYGYNLGQPKTFTLWEAQFGDFANGAQVVIDQFLASAQAKWGQHNGLTLLLPHGYEGQGPEHSSARIERFLQLCAEENMRVAYPSTPAQIFHLLRHQAKAGSGQPLVVFTPKSLLRNPAATSPLSSILRGQWQPVLADTAEPKTIKKVVICTGKLYYDLAAKREETKRTDVALIRLEQLYPFPAAELERQLKIYGVRDVVWAQEEPRNMGAWAHVREYWGDSMGYLHYVGRPASASPAVGTTKAHAAQQAEIINTIFAATGKRKAAE